MEEELAVDMDYAMGTETDNAAEFEELVMSAVLAPTALLELD
ncbi:hypothetical protein [Mycobacterium sp. 155]|nr:hypothetical protein [Mycobacterium sp. 155]